ncbi:MAG: hypothetical protein LBD48_13965 [Treponema sp.]|jgi:hypothetical protein|nr:hypothetical protein [Treponema sp.]
MKRKRSRGILAFVLVIILALAGTAFWLLIRPPVLVVTDVPFVALYGPKRILLRQIRASLALFRLVQPVVIAEGAGSDILVFAIEDAVSRPIRRRPYCVLFPHRYADGARRYVEQFPGVPAVLLEGRNGPESRGGTEGIAVFNTDLERDLYRAGVCAAILSRGTNGIIPVLQDRFAYTAGQDAFIEGLRAQQNETNPLFLNDISGLSGLADISCAVLAGSGAAYLEQNQTFPVVLFTWLDPEVTAREVAVIFDDSPWALAVPAVKMIAGNQTEGRIPSDLLFFPERIADKDILRRIKNAASGLR